MKILIIRLGAIGDIVMTTPILKAIKIKYPKSEITYVVGKWSADVLKNNPYIDELKVIDEKIFFNKNFKQLGRLIRELRKNKFNYGIALDKSWVFNLFIYLCNVKKRYGFDRGYHLINRILTHKNVYFNGRGSEYEYYAAITQAFGAEYNPKNIQLYPSQKEKQEIDKLVNKKQFIAIAPGGATNPGQKALQKRWPLNYYLELINHLKKNNIAVIGGKTDLRYNRIFDDVPKVHNFTGKFSIRGSFYLLKKYCNMFITHDSGPMHLATGTNIKLVVLFGPTQYWRFAPPNARVITPADYTPSYTADGTFIRSTKSGTMNNISTEQVLEVLNEKD